MLDVVGTLYFKDNKLLLVKPSRRPCLQMVGGKIEPGETIYEAAYRESCEELGPNASVDKDKFKFIMDFVEDASSDPNLKIHMHVFLYEGEIEGTLTTSEEISYFVWYNSENSDHIVSKTLENEIIPYVTINNLIN